jgi:hypothetical protein
MLERFPFHPKKDDLKAAGHLGAGPARLRPAIRRKTVSLPKARYE